MSEGIVIWGRVSPLVVLSKMNFGQDTHEFFGFFFFFFDQLQLIQIDCMPDVERFSPALTSLPRGPILFVLKHPNQRN